MLSRRQRSFWHRSFLKISRASSTKLPARSRQPQILLRKSTPAEMNLRIRMIEITRKIRITETNREIRMTAPPEAAGISLRIRGRTHPAQIRMYRRQATAAPHGSGPHGSSQHWLLCDRSEKQKNCRIRTTIFHNNRMNKKEGCARTESNRFSRSAAPLRSGL